MNLKKVDSTIDTDLKISHHKEVSMPTLANFIADRLTEQTSGLSISVINTNEDVSNAVLALLYQQSQSPQVINLQDLNFSVEEQQQIITAMLKNGHIVILPIQSEGILDQHIDFLRQLHENPVNYSKQSALIFILLSSTIEIADIQRITDHSYQEMS